MVNTSFSITSDEGFYLIVADEVTVYESYQDAVGDIKQELADDVNGFLAEVAIEPGTDDDDVAVTLEQVAWPQIIRDMDTDEMEARP